MVSIAQKPGVGEDIVRRCRHPRNCDSDEVVPWGVLVDQTTKITVLRLRSSHPHARYVFSALCYPSWSSFV